MPEFNEPRLLITFNGTIYSMQDVATYLLPALENLILLTQLPLEGLGLSQGDMLYIQQARERGTFFKPQPIDYSSLFSESSALQRGLMKQAITLNQHSVHPQALELIAQLELASNG